MRAADSDCAQDGGSRVDRREHNDGAAAALHHYEDWERRRGAQGWAMMMGRRVLIIRFDNIMIVLLSELYRLYLVQFQIVKWRS